MKINYVVLWELGIPIPDIYKFNEKFPNGIEFHDLKEIVVLYSKEENNSFNLRKQDSFKNISIVLKNQSNGFWEKNEYGLNGYIQKFEDSTGYWEKYEYGGPYGYIQKSEDSKGEWEIYEYDSNGNIINIESSDGNSLKYEYGENQLKIIDSSDGSWDKYELNENCTKWENSEGRNAVYDCSSNKDETEEDTSEYDLNNISIVYDEKNNILEFENFKIKFN